MKPTPISLLVLIGAGFAGASYILWSSYFGAFSGANWFNLLFPWVLAVVNAAAARWIRGVIANERIGQDSRQVSPLIVVRWLVVGKASAWLGTVLCGLYAGMVLWAIPLWGHLAAAEHDGPIFIVGTVSGFLLAVAGVWLERECMLPPDDDNSAGNNPKRLPPSVGWNT